MDGFVGAAVDQEVIAMANRLHEHEHAVQHERGHARERELRRRQPWARRGAQIVRHHEREHRQRREHRERLRRAAPLEVLLAVPPAADEQAQPDDPVADDHHRGEHGVAREPRFLGAGRQHHRDDQRDLDHGDGDREHERAERLADAVRDDFGVMHRGEHRARERGGDECDGEAFGRHDARQREHQPGGERGDERPARQGGRRDRHGVSLVVAGREQRF